MTDETIRKLRLAIIEWIEYSLTRELFDKKQGFANYNGTDLKMVMDEVVKGIYSVDFRKYEVNDD